MELEEILNQVQVSTQMQHAFGDPELVTSIGHWAAMELKRTEEEFTIQEKKILGRMV